ncbi:MAG: hypothetical protein LAT51_11110, partial [Flavobacteriaceae bacterium]|nr:hypothetical protein [Flavobacteriaceae bacterium]
SPSGFGLFFKVDLCGFEESIKMRKLFLFALTIFIVSCADDFEANNESFEVSKREDPIIFDEERLTDVELMRLDFVKAVGLALKHSEPFREVIKSEALKKFNRDYDVLYDMIKDYPINGNVETNDLGSVQYTSVSELLHIFMPSSRRLSEIEAKLPYLTIFVPTLPEDTFSAELWETNNQVPEVALRLFSTNDVPIFDSEYEEMYVLDSDLIPSYPVVVVKDNERVTLDPPPSSQGNNDLTVFSGGHNTTSRTYFYLTANFDGTAYGSGNGGGFNPDPGGNGGGFDPNPGGNQGGNPGSGCDPGFPLVQGNQHTVNDYLTDSYEVFEEYFMTQQAWQRDNLYYQLTPTNTEDFYVGDYYKEAVTHFQLSGDPYNTFDWIANQQSGPNPDPGLGHQNWATNNAWTDGSFEFQIKVVDNSKSRSFENINLYFPASPYDLFEIEHETKKERRKFWHVWKTTYYRTKITGFKGMDFTSTDINDIQLRLNSWDLNNYSNVWNYHVSEFDIPIQNELTTTKQRKYNLNLDVEGQIKKVGLKFGAEAEDTQTTTRTQKYIDQNDELGQFDVHFGDRILLKNNCNNQLYPMIYSHSMINLEIRPVQVVF